tara:strand:+ start:6193 stop:6453 length:261 start_codon:yes stop_codon:yes gene_type:complete
MSTNIGKVRASVHLIEKQGEKVEREQIEVTLNTFYNGKELGKCVQITLPYNFDKGYFHCTKKQAKKLRKLLKKSFTDEKSKIVEGI